MTSTLLARLQTIVPFWGTVGPDRVPLRTLRLLLVMFAAFNSIFGVVDALANPSALGLLGSRAAIVGAALALLVASYRLASVRDHPRRVLAGVVYGSLLAYGYLAWASNLDAEAILGYLVTALTAAMIYSFVWDRPRPLAALLATSCGIGLLVALTVDASAAEVRPGVFFVIVGVGAVVVFATFAARVRTAQGLRESERRLAQAEALAGTGAWSLGPDGTRRSWSEGMYRIFGVEPDGSPPPSMLDFVHADDRPRCEAEFERLAAGGDASNLWIRAVRADGGVRWIHAVSEAGERPGQLGGVVVDVTDQVAHEAALVRARDEAERANRSKGEFLANMSHEIRTPLTAIIGFAQILREEVDPEMMPLVDPIDTGGQRLLGTLNSVLDLARLDAGPSDLSLSPVDLAAEARDVADLLRPRADVAGLALVVEADRPVVVLADRDAVGRIVTNLLSNAIHFTETGTVRVAVHSRDGRGELVVADTGRGMDAAFLKDLFEPFRQASTGWGRSHEGTGLGTTITRRLVEGMGGTIGVESAPGVGTTFTVKIPEPTGRTDGSAPDEPQASEAARAV